MSQDTHPVNVFNFCPRCGSQEFGTLGTRAKKCKHCSFIYYFNTSSAVAALIFDEAGRLMLTRRAIEPHFGKLDLPGGFVDPMETAEEALSRELREELGIEINNIEYYCSFPNEYPFSGLSVFTLDLAFKVKVAPDAKITPMDDISAFEFYYPKEINLKEIPGHSIRKIVEKVVSEKNRINKP